MSETSVLNTIAESVEQELARVLAARPSLASRISRAENIVVTHLSCKRARMIRVRVSGGQSRFLVNGSEGAVYVVSPSDWSCTCPDHHRRGKGCKHALACWALWRASARPAEGALLAAEGLEHVGEIVESLSVLRRCSSCGGRFACQELIEVGPEEAEWTLAASEGDALCLSCARDHGVL